MRIRLSTWLLLALLFTTTLVAALPRVFLPASWFKALPHQEYGFTMADLALVTLLFSLVIIGGITLLYAAIRAALQPTFRRDALVLGAAVLLDGAGWLVASWFMQR